MRHVLLATIAVCAINIAGCDTPEDRLFKQLKSGDVTLYMRHTPTEQKKEAASGPFDDCGWQRNLNDQGKQLAAEIGTGLRSLKLPIESVLSSPLCRAMDTAKLVFGNATPEPALKLGPKGADGKIDVSPIHKIFARTPPKGRVVAIVGHETPELGFKPQLREGESAVLRPKAGGYEEIGRIPPAQWAQWAKTKS